jgi:hypothetical protein
MKSKRVLPIPFLILILAGVASLFSMVAGGNSKPDTVRDNSLQMQTVEQERVAALYFRVLSWLAEFTSPKAPATKPQSQTAPTPRSVQSRSRRTCQAKPELCVYHSAQKPAEGRHTPILD